MTPPFTSGTPPRRDHAVYDANGRLLGGPIDNGVLTDDERRHLARLWAAAPELLWVALELVRLNQLYSVFGVTNRLGDVLDVARAVIAKLEEEAHAPD